MNRLNPKMIIFGLVLTGILTMSLLVKGQDSKVVDTGTMINNISFTDIKGNKTNLHDYLGQGYMVVIELSLTTCNICWAFHRTAAFEKMYRDYGPNGKVTPKKIMPIMIECDPSTNRADLNGTGSRTMGDWVSGISHPIVDLTKENYQTTLSQFFKSGIAFPTPTFLVICPDGRLIYSGQGLGAVDERMLVKLMQGRCAAGGVMPTGVQDMSSFPVLSVYPNPVDDMLYIQGDEKVSSTLYNMEGREIIRIEDNNALSLKGLAVGPYLLRITDKEGRLIRTEKVLKQ